MTDVVTRSVRYTPPHEIQTRYRRDTHPGTLIGKTPPDTYRENTQVSRRVLRAEEAAFLFRFPAAVCTGAAAGLTNGV